MIKFIIIALLILVFWRKIKRMIEFSARETKRRNDETMEVLGWRENPPSPREFFRVVWAVCLHTMIGTLILCAILAPIGSLLGRIFFRGGK